MWRFVDWFLVIMSVALRSARQGVRQLAYTIDSTDSLPSSSEGSDMEHPNAALVDVDMSAVDRRQVLTSPYPPSRNVPKIADIVRIYGDPSGGNPKATKAVYAWEARYMVSLRDLPGSWNGLASPKLYVHQFMAPYLQEALERLHLVGLIHEIEAIGCFNFRRKRHSKNLDDDLSMHAYGVAIDINPDKNFAVYARKTQQSPRHRPVGTPWSKEWKAIWPNGLSEDIVLAFEAVGFKWGGRWKTFVDPMHFELIA